ncbi:hypothetical protein QJS04_geneDACA012400 [Acorus gramineus]|uniref:Bifunctional inhibitor/plant lipid transfer protein/seed storage helical domain-containing protein n=1 Tax=Acorus gramineus TaxID=55184 RepID=A0AAV9BDV5_ACOGR|nr:hypothetical protein QJS04_geneDACA012400 [Acorus gramineus]
MTSSKALATTSLLLTLNLLLFTLASSTCHQCPGTGTPVPVNPVPVPVHPVPVPVNPVPVVPKHYPSCPRDALKLGVCADLLGLVHVALGSQSNSQCCSLIAGLADLDAAACFCTAIRANVLGVNLNIDVSLSLLLNACGCSNPEGYKCY